MFSFANISPDHLFAVKQTIRLRFVDAIRVTVISEIRHGCKRTRPHRRVIAIRAMPYGHCPAKLRLDFEWHISPWSDLTNHHSLLNKTVVVLQPYGYPAKIRASASYIYQDKESWQSPSLPAERYGHIHIGGSLCKQAQVSINGSGTQNPPWLQPYGYPAKIRASATYMMRVKMLRF